MQPIQNTVFTPKLAQGTNDGKLKTGTTTVGLVCKDCIILAADKRATAGHMIVDKKVKKVLPVTENLAVTTAGSVSDIQLLYKYLHSELKLKKIRNNRSIQVREAAHLLGMWVYHLLRSSYGIAHFIMGGYDSEPRLFDIYPDGSMRDADDYVVSGSGSIFALGVLENRYEANMTEEQGVELVVSAINAALARDSASGNGIDVLVINKDGIREVLSKTVLTTV